MSAVLDLADLAAEQWGLVTTAQARAVGVSAQAVARFTNNGALERMTHGVYRVTGAPATPLDNLRAAWLALDPARRAGERLRDHAPAVVSHRSAAAIHHLGDLEADEYEFTSSQRKQTRRPDIRIHRGQVDPGEWTVVDGLPVTTVIRTVDDLAADRIDGGHLASVVRDALTQQQVNDQELIATLRRHAHHYSAPLGDGEALLARLLKESGISEPIERAVALAMPDASGQTITPQQLAETLAAFQRAMAPALLASQQVANSAGVRAAAETVERMQSIVDTPSMRAAAEAAQRIANSPGMKAAAETAERMQAIANSPAMRRLANQHAEVAEISRLARQVTKAAATDAPLIKTPDVVLGEIEER